MQPQHSSWVDMEDDGTPMDFAMPEESAPLDPITPTRTAQPTEARTQPRKMPSAWKGSIPESIKDARAQRSPPPLHDQRGEMKPSETKKGARKDTSPPPPTSPQAASEAAVSVSAATPTKKQLYTSENILSSDVIAARLLTSPQPTAEDPETSPEKDPNSPTKVSTEVVVADSMPYKMRTSFAANQPGDAVTVTTEATAAIKSLKAALLQHGAMPIEQLRRRATWSTTYEPLLGALDVFLSKHHDHFMTERGQVAVASQIQISTALLQPVW